MTFHFLQWRGKRHPGSTLAKPAAAVWSAVCLCACSFAPQTSIPSCPVRLERNAAVIGCLAPGSWWRIEKAKYAVDRIGYGGVLVVNAFDGNYYAFDLACPVEASPTVRVSSPDGALMVTCPRCGEEYYLGDGLGLPQKGISSFSLLRYQTSCTAAATLYVSN